jgi:hypothetical protein
MSVSPWEKAEIPHVSLGYPEAVFGLGEQTEELQGAEHMAARVAVQHRIAQTPVQLLDMGIITDITWPGRVSANDMIASGLTSQETIDDAARRINEFYVPVNPVAKTRCIDGRHDPQLDEANLGPQVPGGAPGAALAYRLGVDKDDLTRGTFLADAENMIGNYTRLGFAPGGHRDKHSENDELLVGCGAIDGMDQIVKTMTEPTTVDDHKRVVRDLMGPFWDRDNYLRVMGAAVVVNGRSEEYFRDRQAVIDILEKKAKGSVAVLEGDHQECLVAVNMVPDTTLASNRFSESFGGIQAFGYDLWRSLQMANKIMPRPDQAQDRQRFVMARVMSTVATLMALTDGSQRLVVRMPESQDKS